jgi:agmatine deiminase
MPIQVDVDRFVQFKYAPDYLTGKYRNLRADGEIGPTLPFIKNCERSDIVLDGGNVVRWGDRAIVTDKIFTENSEMTRKNLTKELIHALALKELIILPREPFDLIGHSDGMICWLDERSVLINDHLTLRQSYHSHIHRILGRYSLDFVELPYDVKSGKLDGIPTAAGNWMNFLRVENLLIVPVFGLEGDGRAIEIVMKTHPRHSVETIDCRNMADEGGLIHCVTWQAKLPVTFF